MFLVRHASDTMSAAVAVMPAALGVHEALEQVRAMAKCPSHIVVARDGRVRGVVRVCPPLLALKDIRGTGTLGDIADDRYVLTRPDESMFDLFRRFSRGHGENALVVKGEGVPRPEDVVGIISKGHIADAVIGNFRTYS